MIKKIVLKNFRNYKYLDIDFHTNNNLFIGKNGEGKTSILESIYIFSTMKSFRQNSYNNLIKENEAFFHMEAIIEQKSLASKIEISYENNIKKVFFNQDKIKILSDIIGSIKTMIFKQDDLNLIYGTPLIRKEFLNFTLCLASQDYLNTLKVYNLLLKEKNILLKNSNFSKTYLNILNQKWILSASKIILYRYNFIQYVSLYLDKYFDKFKFKNNHIKILYTNSLHSYNEDNSNDLETIQKYLYKLLSLYQSKEIFLKQVFFGPHKDDFSIYINHQLAKNFGSQGQIRIISFILKIISCQYIEHYCNEKVMLLFDDIFFDLDSIRQKIIFKFFKSNQKFFTMTHFKRKLEMENTKIFYIKSLLNEYNKY